WEFGGKLILAITLVALTAGISPGRRAVFLLAAFIFTSLFPDTLFTLLLGLAVWRWLLPTDTQRWQCVGGLLLIAFLAQIKFTYLLLAAAGTGLAVAARLIVRDLRAAVLLAAGFVGAF